jgi:hypothetical protein
VALTIASMIGDKSAEEIFTFMDKGENGMNITEEALLRSGFTEKELGYLKNNIENYGGTLDEVVPDLARRFKIMLWVFFCGFCFFIFLICTKYDDPWYVFSSGISLLLGLLIVAFCQPPIISYKSWRHLSGKKN